MNTTTPHILVVEDSKAHIMIAEYALNKLNIEAHYVQDGLSAIEFITTHKPTLMLLDMRLPGASGEDVLTEAQHIYGDDSIATIIMSAHRFGQYEMEQKYNCIKGYLEKPYRPQQLIDLLSQVVLSHEASLTFDNRRLA